MDRAARLKERLGAFVHHPASNLALVVLILASVVLVVTHLLLDESHPVQRPIELVQLAITAVFVVELAIKFYVAESKVSYFTTYWVDILATIPWAQSLRVLRVLRLLRVFRATMILSRRIRFVSALFRSALGEYVVLGLIMLLLLTVGSFTLYVTERRARHERQHHELSEVDRELVALEAELGLRVPLAGAAPPSEPDEAALTALAAELPLRLDALEAAVRSRLPVEQAMDPAADLPPRPRRLIGEVERLRLRLPRAEARDDPSDLARLENSVWATLFFLVATEPMIDTPSTPMGRAVVLAVMFGGLTTFAMFTGVVTALMVNRLKRRMEIDDMDRYQLVDHLLILGWNRLVPLIIDEVTKARGLEQTPVVVVADVEEQPAVMADHAGNGLVYFVRGDYTRPDVLEQVRVRHAKRAIIVADTTIPRSDQDRDARTVLAALMIERMNPEIYTCAELLNHDNEPHLRAAGIEEVVLTSDAGGHQLALAAIHEGLSDVLAGLMTSTGGGTLVKLSVPEEYVGLPFVLALERCKRERHKILIGVEVNGQVGCHAEGYAMRLNPDSELRLGAQDNLIVITSPAPGAS